jgi:lycopene cyclase domain-containing protein
MNFEYFTALLLMFLFTLFIHLKNNIQLFNSKNKMFLFMGFFFIFGALWDTFTISRGGWIIPVDKTLGMTIGVMPLEDYLFMLISPYFVITIYKFLDSKFK